MRMFLMALVLSLCACAAPKNTEYQTYQRKDPVADPVQGIYFGSDEALPVRYLGLMSYDSANGNAGQMLYQGNAAAVLVEIFTHAVIADGMKNDAMSAHQQEANKVLLPFHDVLAGYSVKMLRERSASLADASVKSLLSNSSIPKKGELWIQSRPLFFMSADKGNVILQNAITVSRYGEKAKPLYQNVVQIVSPAATGSSPDSYWLNDQRLLATSAELFRESIALGYRDFQHPLANLEQAKTFHYRLNGQLNYERGSLIERGCDRLTLRNLRGWLLSVPATENRGAGLVAVTDGTCTQG